jgi:hypothetical protein
MKFYEKFFCPRVLFPVAALLSLETVRGSVPLPAINTNNVIVVTNAAYGAVGDGIFTNTTVIQNAINAATKGGITNGLRGGTVEIPAPGVFLSGPLNFSNNVNLQIDAGAVIQLLPYGSWPGEPYTGTVLPLLNGSSLTNIAVTGSGLIDGQGAPWWLRYSTNNRPVIINFSSCSEVLLQNFTSTNPPVAHIAVKGANAGNISVIGVRLFAPDSDDPVDPSHNTDGCDFAETNALFQDCVISTGDDNIAIGSSGSVSRDILVTNCFFGYGHGLSIGSFTSGGVSNLTVINCTFSNTGNGIKIKSERNRGGAVQNLNYFNITMTNVSWPIQLYSYYEYGLGTLTTLTPGFVAYTAFTSTNPIPYEPPIYRNITISNVTANVPNGQPPLLIWGLPDYPISNVVFKAVNLISSSTSTSGIYNATNIQFIDCSLPVPAGNRTVQLWNAAVIFTNSSASTNQYLLDGLTTNGIGNTPAFYNAQASLKNTNAVAGGAVTIAGSTLTVSNNLALTTATPLNFVVGTNSATVAVKGNLASGGIVNVAAGTGFTNSTYTLITYTGNLSGSLPSFGTLPLGYSCSLSSATANQINLIVTSLPGIPNNLIALGTNLLIKLNWFAASNATGYNLERSTTNGGNYSTIANVAATNYSDAAVNPGTTYFYVVSGTNSAGESANSIQASAVALPSLVSTNLNFQVSGNELQLSWPPDHLGWRLQIQTNELNSGLGTNWVDWPDSTNVFQTNIVFNPGNDAVFLRLIYP